MLTLSSMKRPAESGKAFNLQTKAGFGMRESTGKGRLAWLGGSKWAFGRLATPSRHPSCTDLPDIFEPLEP